MTRQELEQAWMIICQASKEGDFTVTRKKGEWKVQVTSFMDASLAHRIVSYLADCENAEGEADWKPNMFDEC